MAEQTKLRAGGGRERLHIIGEERYVPFQEIRELFSSLEVVFFDTTSIYFEGEGGSESGRRGHSKDNRPDLKQVIAGAILDGEGRPICCEMWPGNGIFSVTTNNVPEKTNMTDKPLLPPLRIS